MENVIIIIIFFEFRFYKAIDIDGSKCVERVWLLRPFVACLPAWFRFMQCLRRYRDSREAFPHLANAAKYATTFFVITFSFLNLQYASESDGKNLKEI